MKRYEIMVQIGEDNNSSNAILDLGGEDGLISTSLNYSITDIMDITKTNSSYSQQIPIPDTKNNRDIFKQIFSLNSDSTYDITKKARCWILRDTVVQFEGYIQLFEIEYDLNANMNIYNVVVYADNATLFTNIGQKLLTDLSLSQYNHVYGPTAIANSWITDYTNGYYYPLLDYTGELDVDYFKTTIGCNTLDFKPAAYIKPLFDQIFLEAGFSYTSDFLNSDVFKKLITPFNNTSLINNITNNITNDNGVFFKATLLNDITADLVDGAVNSNWNTFTADNDLYDPNDLYDTSGHMYISPALTIPFAIKFNIKANFELGGAGTPWTGLADDLWIVIKRSMYNDGTPVSGWSDTPTFTQMLPFGVDAFPFITIGGNPYISLRSYSTTSLGGGSYSMYVDINSDYLDAAVGTTNQPLRSGEEVRFFFLRYAFAGSPTTILKSAGTMISGVLNTTSIVVDTYLYYRDFLPKNIKQIDFILSIFKMFNLVIEPDKFASNNFIIESKDEYYTKYQVIKDWSLKLDSSKNITSQIVSNIQKRNNTFSYKEDKDLYNKIYTENTNNIYGVYEWVIDNDFIDGDSKLNIIFSPSPLTKLSGSDNMYLVVIGGDSVNTSDFKGMGIRILYKDMKTLTGSDEFNFSGTSYTKYPYAAPFDEPLNPNLSINFGQVGSFYENFNDTINNLFYNYWQETMTNLSDKNNRIVTAYFYLNSVDISQFYFSDLIYFRVNNMEGYYRINKISNYDPSHSRSTKVELIKAQNYNIND